MDEINFSKNEKKILNFWEKNQIFQKIIERDNNPKDFVFYEGPPTANGRPGIHHILTRAFKDIICRFKTMQGFRVMRKAGWDTHGLPVELEVEKQLGLKNKKDIEKYGIDKFNKKCKASVWKYKKEWEKLTQRIGFWLDLKNPYITYTTDYIETVWWILKNIWDKGLLYRDFKIAPYCPRCGTTLSSHEVAQGYKKVKEPSIFLKFKILDSEFKDCFLLVWTTTPWTLPANVAVAANPNLVYAKIKTKNEVLILAKERALSCGVEGEVLEEFFGKKLANLKYEPPYPCGTEAEKNAYRVLLGNFVSSSEGSGLVHIAPAFGEDDMELIKTTNVKRQMSKEPEFPILITVDEFGKFNEKVKKWQGMFVKDADPLIIQDLKSREILFKEESYEHDYPFCWRCKGPLLYYATKSWFIKMSLLKEKLIKNNEQINWIPSHLKAGRFGEWLKELKDWNLSRKRYWATPLNIWECEKCKFQEAIGSREDLKKQKFSSNRYFFLRHGESENNIQNDLLSDELNVYPLTKKGIEQAKKAVKNIKNLLKNEKIDIIFSSDILRAKQTAEIVASAFGLKVQFSKELRELKLGEFNQKSVFDYQKFYRNFETPEEILAAKLPGGESKNHCKIRMLKFIEKLEKKYKNKNILIVSHNAPLSMIVSALAGRNDKEILSEMDSFKNGEVREVKFTKFPYNNKGELDFHRPYIDEIKFSCPKCAGTMKRVEELVDVWFDSGAMPFAQSHYPFNKKYFLFPADYICEAIDQTRGWFYTLLAIATLLDFKNSYKNVITVGHVLDANGEKMSKSKGNVVNPWQILDKYGADATRWYFYTINQPFEYKLFQEKDIESCLRKFILTFYNSFVFFETYKKSSDTGKESAKIVLKNILDKWIVSRFNNLIKKTTEQLEKFEVVNAARLIENFVINDLSLWYIRRSRKRFQNPADEEDFLAVSGNLEIILTDLTKLSAPFIPFLTEEIYQKIKKEKIKEKIFSVHMENWPVYEDRMIDDALEQKMEKVRTIVGLGLAARKKEGIRVRQPLAKLKTKILLENELLELIKDEVNVKEVEFVEGLKDSIELDTVITPQLREEGIVREVIRLIQSIRKELKLTPQDKAVCFLDVENDFIDILERNKSAIIQQSRLKELIMEKNIKTKFIKEVQLEGKKIIAGIKKA